MQVLQELFKVEVTSDRLEASLSFRNPDVLLEAEDPIELTKESLLSYLKKQNIHYGIKHQVVEEIVEQFPEINLPKVIAEGSKAIDGEPGEITYHFDMTTEVEREAEEDESFDFRDVMRIPTVEKGERLATIVAPTKGEDGKTVQGTVIKARPGKPALLRPGKNVSFDEGEQSFFAEVDGQVSVINKRIHVHDVYEVNESISMKIGNIDFPGTVIIHGDVPTGFTIKASGDIKIFGLVEAATILAEGSVMVSEGIAGLGTGTIEAGEDVQIGYINQGKVKAGHNILVENSIMHSECTAQNDIICHRGNIVGGVISAGGAIQANNVGNRMNTKTNLSFGMDYKLLERQKELDDKLSTLEDNYQKLKKLEENYKQIDPSTIDQKMRITLLRLQYSLEKTVDQIKEHKEQIASINASLGDVNRAYLKVKKTIYPNVTVQFGRYKRTIDKEFFDVTIVTDKNEIVIRN